MNFLIKYIKKYFCSKKIENFNYKYYYSLFFPQFEFIISFFLLFFYSSNFIYSSFYFSSYNSFLAIRRKDLPVALEKPVWHSHTGVGFSLIFVIETKRYLIPICTRSAHRDCGLFLSELWRCKYEFVNFLLARISPISDNRLQDDHLFLFHI